MSEPVTFPTDRLCDKAAKLKSFEPSWAIRCIADGSKTRVARTAAEAGFLTIHQIVSGEVPYPTKAQRLAAYLEPVFSADQPEGLVHWADGNGAMIRTRDGDLVWWVRMG